jgi:hypothetical protein
LAGPIFDLWHHYHEKGAARSLFSRRSAARSKSEPSSVCSLTRASRPPVYLFSLLSLFGPLLVLLLRLLHDVVVTLLFSSAAGSPALFASSRLLVAAVLGSAPRFVFPCFFSSSTGLHLCSASGCAQLVKEAGFVLEPPDPRLKFS